MAFLVVLRSIVVCVVDRGLVDLNNYYLKWDGESNNK